MDRDLSLLLALRRDRAPVRSPQRVYGRTGGGWLDAGPDLHPDATPEMTPLSNLEPNGPEIRKGPEVNSDGSPNENRMGPEPKSKWVPD